MENINKEGVIMSFDFRFFITKLNQSVLPIRRGEMITMLLPFTNDLINRADSCTRSQKYSGAILPVTMKGLISFAIYILFPVKLIICF